MGAYYPSICHALLREDDHDCTEKGGRGEAQSVVYNNQDSNFNIRVHCHTTDMRSSSQPPLPTRFAQVSALPITIADFPYRCTTICSYPPNFTGLQLDLAVLALFFLDHHRGEGARRTDQTSTALRVERYVMDDGPRWYEPEREYIAEFESYTS